MVKCYYISYIIFPTGPRTIEMLRVMRHSKLRGYLQGRHGSSPRSPASATLKNNMSLLRRQSEPLYEEFEFNDSPSPAKRPRKSTPNGKCSASTVKSGSSHNKIINKRK